MQTPLLIEELVIDDSFINYCYNRNHQDIQYWENYMLIFPDQKANLDEARLIVLGISTMFLQQEQETALAAFKNAAEAKYVLSNKSVEEDDIIMELPTRKLSAKRVWMYAAAAVVIGVGAFFFIQLANPAKQPVQPIAQMVTKKIETLVYTTNYGEKKTIWLPDSSKVILNAKSTLRIDENFGVAEREVNLTGEALFDVTHNEKMPFVVNMKHFDVKVLGTLFNVKAYEEDRIQEASLIRGKVQVIVKNDEKSFFLNPNEKAIIPNNEEVRAKEKIQPVETVSFPTVTGLTINNKDNTIIETSWVYNRLDISDKTFSQISTDLERLYNVTIEFKDKKVANYRFSATFEKETIEQVLKALQLSYPFHYTIDNNRITISK